MRILYCLLYMQGYGKFLISLAYCLSHLEQKPGTAERPLSDLGAVSFRSYWTRQVLDALRDCKGEVTVQVCCARRVLGLVLGLAVIRKAEWCLAECERLQKVPTC